MVQKYSWWTTGASEGDNVLDATEPHFGARSSVLAASLRRDLSVALASALYGDRHRGVFDRGDFPPMDIGPLLAGILENRHLRIAILGTLFLNRRLRIAIWGTLFFESSI